MRLKSSKLSTSQLSDFELVRVLKTFVGNEDLPDSTYVLPIIEQWKKPFLATMQKWAVLFPKLNDLRSNQNMRVDMYQFVPRLDFTRNWTDGDLYDRYELSPEEQEFISLVVRDMDSK